jgi:hypothetical protein
MTACGVGVIAVAADEAGAKAVRSRISGVSLVVGSLLSAGANVPSLGWRRGQAVLGRNGETHTQLSASR